MSDKLSSEPLQPTPFDPAADGWETQEAFGFAELVGPIWRRRRGDRLRFGLLAEAKHLNRAGNMHGGMLMTFADQSMALSARQATGGKRLATIEMNIHFIDAVRASEFVEAYCKVVRTTRSIVFVQTQMLVSARTVLTANGIWKLLDEE